MDCQHRIEHGKLMRCAIAPGVTFPIVGARGNPCEVCQRSWRNGQPPTADRPPLHLAVASRGLAVLAAKPGQRTIKVPALTLPQKIGNAARAFAAFVRSGGKLLDAPTVAARLAVCDGCEHRTTFLRVAICNKCGCALRLKAQLPDQFCPLRLWPGDPPKKRGCCS